MMIFDIFVFNYVLYENRRKITAAIYGNYFKTFLHSNSGYKIIFDTYNLIGSSDLKRVCRELIIQRGINA